MLNGKETKEGAAGTERGRSPSGVPAAEVPAPRPRRWAAARKREVVLRLLKGEPMDALSREMGVEQYRLSEWRDRALTGMDASLKEREEPSESVDLKRAKEKIGEQAMEIELLYAKIGQMESGLGPRRRRSKR